MTGEAPPKAGTYKIRLVKGGPWVPVKIVSFLRAKRGRIGFFAYLGDKVVDLHVVWPRAYGNAISEDEFEYLLKLGRWAAVYDPENPAANPRQAIDLNDQPSLF